MIRTAAALLLVAALGCGRADGPVPEDGGGEARLRAAPPETAVPPETAATAPDDGPAAPPGSVFPDTRGPLRIHAVRLVNPLAIDVLVYASAGGGRVLVDTVPRRDSVRVNLESRAARVRLDAADRWGEPLGAEEIDLAADSVVRWEVPAPLGAGSGSGG